MYAGTELSLLGEAFMSTVDMENDRLFDDGFLGQR